MLQPYNWYFPGWGPPPATLGVGLFLESCGGRDAETGTGGGTDTWAAAGGEQRVILLKPWGMMSTGEFQEHGGHGEVKNYWRLEVDFWEFG